MGAIYRREHQVNETLRFVRENADLVDFFTSDRTGYFEGEIRKI